MKSKKISIIVPCYKAEKFIAGNLAKMHTSVSKIFANFEIIAVVDGFIDHTFEEAKKVEKPGVRVLGYQKNKGKGHALNYGFKHSTGDYVTFIDCDLDIHPEQLQNLVPYMATADLVVGSKRHPFSKLYYPLLRKFLSRGFQLYQKLILGVALRDTQSGLKLIKREVLEIIMPLLMVKRYAFDVELCFLAQKHGFRTSEAPLYLTYNPFKGSTIRFQDIRGMFLDVLAIRYRYSILHYYQKKFWENMGWEDDLDHNGVCKNREDE